MMLRAFAEAASALGDPGYLEAAIRNAEFVTRELMSDGRLLRTWKDGRARLAGYLDDHACYADGLIALYEATFDRTHLDHARQLLREIMIDEFWDETRERLFSPRANHMSNLSAAQSRSSTLRFPSGNLWLLCAASALPYDRRRKLLIAAPKSFCAPTIDAMEESAVRFAHMLCALDLYLKNRKRSCSLQCRMIPVPAIVEANQWLLPAQQGAAIDSPEQPRSKPFRRSFWEKTTRPANPPFTSATISPAPRR